jgi:peptide/nickel transport system substrate-binding protein
MLRKSHYRILTVSICSLFLWSCTKSCTRSKNGQQTITVDIASPVESLDPRYTTSAAASRVAKLIYAPLFEVDDEMAPKPFLAESIVALDEKTFKITLKKNLFFHDGTPLLAHDVVYTFQELGSPDVVSPHAEKFSYVENIKALDDTEVVFALKQPHAPLLTDLSAIGIVSKKACLGRSQQCRHENIGSGPYTLKKWDNAKETIELSPFAKWFEGAPKSTLLFRIVRDENTRILELIGKKADFIDGDFSPNNMVELKKHDHLTVSEVPGLGYAYLAINVRGPRHDDKNDSPQHLTRRALADKNVRKAIAQAIDFDQIIEKLLLNSADRVSGLIPNGHWAKDASLKAPAFDPKAAEALMDQAGFKKSGPDQMRFKLTIATTPNRVRQNCAQLYADFLKRVGIDASIRVKDWSALYEDMKQGQFELFSAIWVPVTDPDLYYFVHHSASIPEGDKVGGNRHGYKNPDVDRLIELGRTTMDQEKRKVIYQEIEQKLIEDLPYIPLWNEHRIVVFNKEKIQGFKASTTGSLLWLRNAHVAPVQ